MRRTVALALVLAACSGTATTDGSEQERVSTTAPVTVPPVTSTSEPTPATTSTTSDAPASSTTSTSPTTTTTLPALQSLGLEEVASFDAPIEAVAAAGEVYVASKEGRVWRLGDEPEVVLDIRGPVVNRGEQGLLGLAFHPDFPSDPRFFVHYIGQDGSNILASYELIDGVVDGNSVAILLTVPQPASNHNGGKIAFGPDDHLYLALGDGGRSNDAFGNGQNRDSLLGSILRLDVSTAGGYVTPADNPFANDGAAELWAIGLRNPWRFDFDGDTIYIADVGQNAYEEVSVVRVEPAGYNFGWPITEGLHCFRPSSGCDAAGITLPIVEVEHGDDGTCSITGGLVYRGSAIPELHGHYLYSDYCGGYLRSFSIADGTLSDERDWTEDTGRLGQVVAFGEDAAGEVLIMTADGMVRRLVAGRS